jgi:hypothetical protein
VKPQEARRLWVCPAGAWRLGVRARGGEPQTGAEHCPFFCFCAAGDYNQGKRGRGAAPVDLLAQVDGEGRLRLQLLQTLLGGFGRKGRRHLRAGACGVCRGEAWVQGRRSGGTSGAGRGGGPGLPLRTAALNQGRFFAFLPRTIGGGSLRTTPHARTPYNSIAQQAASQPCAFAAAHPAQKVFAQPVHDLLPGGAAAAAARLGLRVLDQLQPLLDLQGVAAGTQRGRTCSEGAHAEGQNPGGVSEGRKGASGREGLMPSSGAGRAACSIPRFIRTCSAGHPPRPRPKHTHEHHHQAHTLAMSRLACRRLKVRSALEWRPKSSGLSWGGRSSTAALNASTSVPSGTAYTAPLRSSRNSSAPLTRASEE